MATAVHNLRARLGLHSKNHRLPLILALVPLVLGVWACQAATGFRQDTPTAQSSPPTPVPSITDTPQPTATRTPTPSPSPSPSATATPSATPTPTIVITPSALQLSVFEELWQVVNEEYLYADFNGLDWNAIHEEYRQRIEAGLTDADFYLAMDELIARLGDEHSAFLDPEQARAREQAFSGKNDFVGVGMLVNAVPERDRAVVLAVFPASPAEAAGLRPRDNLLAVNGEAILDQDGFLKDTLLRGPEGSPITLTVQTPGQAPRELSMNRQRVTGAIPVPSQVLTTPGGKRIGYLLLVTFNDTTITEQVASRLQEMTRDTPLDGLIIDNRENTGGADTVMRGILSYFTQGTLGHFVSRKEVRPLEVAAAPIDGSQQMPLVVLVGQDTVSYGEVFSGVLKDIGRADLIGETTEGNVETLWGYDFEDGSRLWLAHESFRPLNHPEQDWEATGIMPDQTVEGDIDQYPLESDPVVQAALEFFDR